MAAIKGRVRAEVKLRQAEVEWQAKTISHFIIATVEGEKAQKQLYKSLDSISLINPNKKRPSSDEADTSTSKPAFNYADIEERGNYDAALERNSRRKGGLPFAGPLPS